MLIKTNDNLMEKVESLENKLEELTLATKITEDLEEQLNEAVDGISDLKQQLSEAKFATLEQLLDAQNDKVAVLYQGLHEEPVAFSARVKQNYQDIAPGATIKFANIVTNMGNAFSGTSGEFTAPQDGLYMFYVHILTGHEHSLEAVLQINGVHQLWVYCDKTYGHGSGNNLIVVHLEAGDKVKVIKSGIYGMKPFYIHALWSTFSGYLIKAD